MRRLIAAVVVVSQVAVSVPVWAQDAVVVPRDLSTWVPPCSIPPMGMSAQRWNSYTPEQREIACKMGYDPWAPSKGDMVSAKLAIAGILIAAAGFGVAFHPSEDTYHILGDSYCVGDTYVNDGGCGSPLETQIGLGMIGGGILMAWVGLRTKHVSVSPSINKTQKGVTARIRW